MIDVHCHILPGLDDGPETLAESVAMCRLAAADGIKTIVATPHFRPGRYEFTTDRVAGAAAMLQRELDSQGVDITILTGADVSITPELPRYLKNDASLTINATGKYFLAEFPHDNVPLRWEAFLSGLLQNRIIPILTHPERNRWFINNPGSLYPFVRSGGLVQVTAMSLTGEYGAGPAECCRLLMRSNLVHVIASDAHSVSERRPVLSEAVQAASAIVGPERAHAMVGDVPRAIVEGKQVAVMEPLPVMLPDRRKTWAERLAALWNR